MSSVFENSEGSEDLAAGAAEGAKDEAEGGVRGAAPGPVAVRCPQCAVAPDPADLCCPSCREDLSALVRLRYSGRIAYNEALAMARAGRLEAAELLAERALEAEPGLAAARELLGRLHRAASASPGPGSGPGSSGGAPVPGAATLPGPGPTAEATLGSTLQDED